MKAASKRVQYYLAYPFVAAKNSFCEQLDAIADDATNASGFWMATRITVIAVVYLLLMMSLSFLVVVSVLSYACYLLFKLTGAETLGDVVSLLLVPTWGAVKHLLVVGVCLGVSYVGAGLLLSCATSALAVMAAALMAVDQRAGPSYTIPASLGVFSSILGVSLLFYLSLNPFLRYLLNSTSGHVVFCVLGLAFLASTISLLGYTALRIKRLLGRQEAASAAPGANPYYQQAKRAVMSIGTLLMLAALLLTLSVLLPVQLHVGINTVKALVTRQAEAVACGAGVNVAGGVLYSVYLIFNSKQTPKPIVKKESNAAAYNRQYVPLPYFQQLDPQPEVVLREGGADPNADEHQSDHWLL